MEPDPVRLLFHEAWFGSLEGFLPHFQPEYANAEEEGCPLLMVAIARRRFEIAKFLLDHGADANRVNPDGQNALHHAAMFQDLELATRLLEVGCDLHHRDRWGNNPLWVAVFHCKGRFYEMVELLLRHSPDLHTKNRAGRSPYDFALQVNNERLIDLLDRCKDPPEIAMGAHPGGREEP